MEAKDFARMQMIGLASCGLPSAKLCVPPLGACREAAWHGTACDL